MSMLGTLGSLFVDLRANAAGFQSDMGRATRIAAKESEAIRKKAVEIGRAFGAAAAAGGVAFAAIVASAARAARETQNLARLANTSAQEYQRWAYAARTVGVEQDKVGDILKDVQDKVGDFLSTGGGALADFFENIAPLVGVTAEQFRELSGPDALQLYVDSLEKANVSQSEMVFYLEALASDTTALLPLLRNGGMQLRSLGDDAERLGLVLSDMEIEQLAEIEASFRTLRGAVTGVKNDLVGAVVPSLSEVADEVARIAKENRQIFDDDSLGKWAGEAAYALAVAAESVFAVLKAVRAVAGSFEVVAADVQVAATFISRGHVWGQAFESNRKALADALEQRNRTVEEADARYSDLWNYNATALSDAIRRRLDEAKGYALQMQDVIDAAIGLQGPLMQDEVNIPMRLGFSPSDGSARPRRGSRRDKPGADAPKPTVDVDAQSALREAMEAEQAIRDTIAALEEQALLYGKNAREVELYRLQQMGATQADIERADTALRLVETKEQDATLQEHLNQLYASNIELLTGTDAATRAYQQTMTELNELLARGRINQDEYNAAVERAQDALDETSQKADEFSRAFVGRIQSTLGDTIYDTMAGQFKDIGQRWLELLNRMVADAASAQIGRALFGPDGTGGGMLDGVLSAAASFLGFGGPDGARAGGGDVYPGVWYRANENGPEYFQPHVPGTMVPASKMDRPINLTNNIHVTTPTGHLSANTRLQMLTEVGRATREALRRND